MIAKCYFFGYFSIMISNRTLGVGWGETMLTFLWVKDFRERIGNLSKRVDGEQYKE